ncbi:leucine-rich repeat domain-containing protein [Spongiivirga citrea]|uniref:Leucine-rich repeat domain-containing protein n=1 Tax=Spongiivirga citrea TaxID=1481457 RepID=A0A6M0CQB7_9FLAO|nr:hypothetical protein [Spongiivirga citrea]NER18069.1 hypothetical protein [Spongiivirga citrea]
MLLRYFFLLTILLLTACNSDDSYNDDERREAEPQRTLIPDSAFERSLIELSLDDVEDGSVLTSNIENKKQIFIDDKGITDLTGIQDFRMLYDFRVNDNNITELDLTKNTNLKFLSIDNNGLKKLKVTGLPILEKVFAKNNDLNEIDITSNTNLQLLDIADNQVERIDVSQNPELFTFGSTNNPFTCIQVSGQQLQNIPPNWSIADNNLLSTSCY